VRARPSALALGRIVRRARIGLMERAAGAREILDGPVPAGELRRSLADVARLNALFGGRRLTLAHVERLVAGWPPARRLTVLDVGTGSGDIPRALVRWGRRTGRAIRGFALDRDAATLELARAASRRYREIVFLQGDALALPLRPAAVDVAISSLTLHHLEPGPAQGCLAQMDAVARRGWVVNDLARSRVAWALVWLATRVFARSAISRHDGPLSVRRAYTAEEVRALCERAGLAAARVRRYPLVARQCVVRAKR
jgi:ubiquinone/menaquinone biosynthesis C-methylase UbiE